MDATNDDIGPPPSTAPPAQAGRTDADAANGISALLTHVSTTVATPLTLSRYRRVMATPGLYFIEQTMVATRAYVRGMEAGLCLLAFTHEHRGDLSASELHPRYTCADIRRQLVCRTRAARRRELMPLDPGTTLGAYTVTAQIGAGGMGECLPRPRHEARPGRGGPAELEQPGEAEHHGAGRAPRRDRATPRPSRGT